MIIFNYRYIETTFVTGIISFIYWYASVIPKVPREQLFWQRLARCDYFQTSLKIAKPDIYRIVGICAIEKAEIMKKWADQL